MVIPHPIPPSKIRIRCRITMCVCEYISSRDSSLVLVSSSHPSSHQQSTMTAIRPVHHTSPLQHNDDITAVEQSSPVEHNVSPLTSTVSLLPTTSLLKKTLHPPPLPPTGGGIKDTAQSKGTPLLIYIYTNFYKRVRLFSIDEVVCVNTIIH